MKTATLPKRFAAGCVALATGLLVAFLNGGAWWWFQNSYHPPKHEAPVSGLSYNPAGRWQNPLTDHRPSMESLQQDLALLARQTRRIRTYSAGDHPELPALARKQGLEVMLGAFLDDRLDINQRELKTAIELAHTHPNIRRLIVGNETQLTAKLPPNRLIAYLDQSRTALRPSGVQVSTAEPWHVWLDLPQLADHVDFLAIHVLPYWEGESIETAVQTALAQIARVKARFPDRPVVIAEIGWPSNGQPVGRARATPANQAIFVRDFLHQASALGLDYYLIEAFDQPWKIATEGRAGAYWGLWDAWRQPKFDLQGEVPSDPNWRHKAVLSGVLGVGLALPFLLGAPGLGFTARLALGAASQAVASLAVVLLSVPLAHYLTGVDLVGLVLVTVALVFICTTLLAQSFEFVERFWSRQPIPRNESLVVPDDQPGLALPFVSIHLACANEPPESVIEAVESLLAIDWPAFEVIVVDNNTHDRHAREQLARWMAQQSDPKLRFAQFETLPGYKAGALNQALALTHPKADWVAVVDADYTVDPCWFRAVRPHLMSPEVGVVQAPQAHRHWGSHTLQRMMNWETEGFFRIGMHHRNQRNAIVQHGTMTLVRAADLQRLRWNEDCICEDTELGLRLLREGRQAVYVDRVLGTGLLPADFVAYARQRRRWALGAVHIFKTHARSLLGRSPLTAAQRYHFLAGWLPWLGDALHLLFSLVMITFSLGMVYLPQRVEPPLWLFVAPLMAFFTARLLIGPLLYARCVPCSLWDRLGAAVAGMALSHRIARGVWHGLRTQRGVFEITRKSAPETVRTRSPEPGASASVGPPLFRGIEEETALLAGLVFCTALLWLTHEPSDSGRLGWIAILFVQSLPYWATLVCRLIEVRDRVTRSV